MIERAGLALLRCFDPEIAHALALKALHTPFAPLPGPVTSPVLQTSIAGLDLPIRTSALIRPSSTVDHEAVRYANRRLRRGGKPCVT